MPCKQRIYDTQNGWASQGLLSPVSSLFLPAQAVGAPEGLGGWRGRATLSDAACYPTATRFSREVANGRLCAAKGSLPVIYGADRVTWRGASVGLSPWPSPRGRRFRATPALRCSAHVHPDFNISAEAHRGEPLFKPLFKEDRSFPPGDLCWFPPF